MIRATVSEMTTDPDDFSAAVALAGYFLAHGIWSVSDGGAVFPMIAHEGEAGRAIQRFAGDDTVSGVREAEEWLDENPSSAARAVMIVDGYADLEGTRRDALIARVISYGPPKRSLHIIVPYRPRDSAEGFAVHSPRFGADQGLEGIDLDALGQAFFSGVGAHLAAAPIWQEHLDESI